MKAPLLSQGIRVTHDSVHQITDGSKVSAFNLTATQYKFKKMYFVICRRILHLFLSFAQFFLACVIRIFHVVLNIHQCDISLIQSDLPIFERTSLAGISDFPYISYTFHLFEISDRPNEPSRGKTNNVVSEQVRHKPTCTSTEES